MSAETQRLIRVLIDVAGLVLMLYMLWPGRPPLDALAWRTLARAADVTAGYATRLSLSARTRYWRAVNP